MAELQRKLIAITAETRQALDLLAKDRNVTLQDLADEAFADLLKKHRRPVGLEAACVNRGALPANDARPERGRKRG